MKRLATTTVCAVVMMLPAFLAAQTARPDAVAADPAHYAVLQENDVVQ